MADNSRPLPDVRISLVPKAVVVVSAVSRDGEVAATTIAWNGVISSRPPVVAVSFLPDSFCRQCILETRDFVVNIPDGSMLAQVEQLGATSGPLFSKTSGPPLDSTIVLPSVEIKAPRLAGYFLSLECRVLQSVQIGLYDCFHGLVVKMHARQDVVMDDHPRGNIAFDKVPPLMCFGDQYWSGGEFLGRSNENKDHPHGERH